MPVYLLLAAIVIFACVFLNKLSSKLGIPTLLAFILLGMFFGSDGIVKIHFDNYEFAEQICSVALIFIMFYGGFGTNWKEAKPVAAKAVLLSSLGVIMTSGLVGLFCHFALKISWLESFLIGSVIGSTDAASVFSILRSKRLNLKYNTASLLEVESGSNDPFSYMLTMIMLSVMNGTASGAGIAYMIFTQLAYGILLGVAIAFVSIWLMKRLRFAASGFDSVFVTAVAILSYAAPAAIGGNGYLCAYIVGIALGNADIKNKKTLVPFFDGLTGLMQMLIFFLLGLLAFPSQLPQVALPALAIALFLTFIARPAAVFTLLTPFGSKFSQQLTVSWAGLRGAASIVFAVMATMNSNTGYDIFHMVFFIVLFSILLQGSLLPFVSGKLSMIDEHADVMKTFSDYSNEMPVQFIQFTVPEDHPWCNIPVKDIILPPDTLFVLLQRYEEKLVPKGETVLQSNDTLLLSAKSPGKIEGVRLTEQQITEESEIKGKQLGQLPKKESALIILVMRGQEAIIPNGNTVLEVGDTLVINHTD